jgi:cell wall-associated NlpC family hydrolase
VYTTRNSSTRRRAVQHRRRTGPAARGRAAATALGALLTCITIAGTALAAAGGGPADPADAVLQIARQQLGDPYGYGATGPDNWDCSGLTSRLWREVGGVKDIPRVSRDQQAWAVPIPAEQLLVGDLVFFGNPVTHVALYAGNGTVVDASSSQHKVVERKIWKQSDIRYGRVPRPGMPAVTPWTAPSPSPSPSATAGTTTGAATGTPTAQPTTKPTTRPATKPSPQPSPTATRDTSDSAALTAPPLRGLPVRDLPAVTTIAARAVNNALSVRGSTAWTDVTLVQAAWRHAGGGLLPKDRVALVAAGSVVPVGAARIGDLVVYGAPASHVGVYLGHGYLVDASPTLGRVVVRRVFASSTVRIVRLDVR